VEVEKVKKRLFLLLAATLLCIGMTWDASAKPSNQPKQVIFGMAQFQTNLDPALDWNGWYVYMYGMGETLVKFNEKMEIQPLLADSWQRVNALTWKFHIRKGVTFHNGRPVTAAAVKTSLERSLRLNKRAQEILLIDLIAAQGQELTITTKTPYEAFLGNMADPLAIVVDATAPESTFAKAPVGTGPFKIKSYRENEQVTVEKYQGTLKMAMRGRWPCKMAKSPWPIIFQAVISPYSRETQTIRWIKSPVCELSCRISISTMNC
jgi:peptide/nickel transport system substrate-binding protein